MLLASAGVLGFLALHVVLAGPPPVSSRPNVVLILSDDLNTRVRCYGDSRAITPNIDRLAARGVLFSRALCQYPLCNPSRTSLFFGARPDATGVHDNVANPRVRLGDRPMLHDWFRKHGYYTASVGKGLHFPDPPSAWDDYVKIGQTTGRGLKGVGEYEWGVAEDGSQQHDSLVADKASEVLRRQVPGRPFFLVVGFRKPHVPLVAPKRFFDMFPPELALPAAGPTHGIPAKALKHAGGTPARMSDSEKRQFPVGLLQRDRVHGFRARPSVGGSRGAGSVEQHDRRVCLRQRFRDRRTGAVRQAGAVRRIDPHPLHYRGSRSREGQDLRAAGRAAGLFPTLTALSNLPDPPSLGGSSLAALLASPAAARTRSAISEVHGGGNRGTCVRTERFSYTLWRKEAGQVLAEELYDLESDPGQLHNLAADRGNAGTVAEMRKLLPK